MPQEPVTLCGRISRPHLRAAVLDVLRAGPLSPHALSRAIGANQEAMMHHVRMLVAAGDLRTWGMTSDRRIALASWSGDEIEVVHPPPRGITVERQPGTLDEALRMVDYNERILATSESAQRRERSRRMLLNLAPVVTRLRAEEAAQRQRDAERRDRIAALRQDEEFEVIWNGGEGLSSHMGASSLRNPE